MNSSTDDNVRLRIHVGMDVWDAYQEHYIGSVVRVWRGSKSTPRGARQVEKEDTVQSHPLVHEEGRVASHAADQGRREHGEAMGPFPTVDVGNHGPISQSADADYATGRSLEGVDVVSFAVRPGRLNLGFLTRPFYIPSAAVLSISMERIVLTVHGGNIPAEWRRRPGD
jgi:hypothetical protein